MKYEFNERKVRTLINIDSRECYEQMIPCHYCGYVLNLEEIKEEENKKIYLYKCCNCGAQLTLTYKPFIKNLYVLEHEKWDIEK